MFGVKFSFRAFMVLYVHLARKAPHTKSTKNKSASFDDHSAIQYLFWNAACYTKHNDNNFPKMGRDDLDDSLMGVNDLESDDPHRFQMTRNGDHMMLLFQCDMCHFMNIQRRVPQESSHQDFCIFCFRALHRKYKRNFMKF